MVSISVVVPIFKVEKYIHRCIDSILAQTFTDFELILVDDGSPDTCGAICDEYAARDSRIHVIHQSNQGVSVARNTGVQYATGNYITFIDSDDWISSDFLSELWKAVSIHYADVAVAGEVRVLNDKIQEVSNSSKQNIMTPREAIQKFGKKAGPGIRTPWGKLVSSQIIKKFPFPEERSFGEDMACVYRWYWEANKIVECEDRLYYYNIRESSLSRGVFSDKRLSVYDTYDEMIDFFIRNDFTELSTKYLSNVIVWCINDYHETKIHNQWKNRKKIKEILCKMMRKYLSLDSNVLYDNYAIVAKVLQRNISRSFSEAFVGEALLENTVEVAFADSNKKSNRMIQYKRRQLKWLLIYDAVFVGNKQSSRQWMYKTAFPALSEIVWMIEGKWKTFRKINDYS